MREQLKILVTEYFADTYPQEYDAVMRATQPGQVITDIAQVQSGDIILPRYRTVPFGELLEAEVQERGARLINSAQESQRVRDIYAWAHLLGDMTAPCYSLENVDEMPECGYFVKGQTSSLKNRGPQAVFSTNKADAIRLAQEITEDNWLSHEKPVMRPVQPYKRLGTSERGLPVFHERRVFTYRGILLSEGFYWESQRHMIRGQVPCVDSAFYSATSEAMYRVREVAPFLVIDMAQYEDGSWGVVELNDGCQSGITGKKDFEMYSNLVECCSLMH